MKKKLKNRTAVTTGARQISLFRKTGHFGRRPTVVGRFCRYQTLRTWGCPMGVYPIRESSWYGHKALPEAVIQRIRSEEASMAKYSVIKRKILS